MKKILMLVLAAAFFVGCSEDKTAEPQAAGQALPANLIATSQPSGAVNVVDAKKSAKDGDAIIVRGRIGGTEKPLAANLAMMTLLESSVKTCNQIPDDKCPTPWDACCESQEERTAKTVSVEVVGADGKPLHATLQGAGGIAPLKEVVVAGTAKTSGDSMVVVAKEIYVVP